MANGSVLVLMRRVTNADRFRVPFTLFSRTSNASHDLLLHSLSCNFDKVKKNLIGL